MSSSDTRDRETGHRSVKQVKTYRFQADGQEPTVRDDSVATENMVVIDIDGDDSYSLLCTPTDLRALAVGFAYTEGIICGMEDIAVLRECEEDALTISMRLADGRDTEKTSRNLLVTSACGMCGRRQALAEMLEDMPEVGETLDVAPEFVLGMVQKLRAQQEVFAETGGTHAAALFSTSGELRGFAEDIGRHCALDKSIGECLLGREETSGCGTVLSGRISWEMVAKSSRAGVELIAAVSAPSALAVRAARRTGMTLCGFVRDGRLVAYSHPHRLI